MMSTSIDSTGSEHRRHGNQSESSQNKYEEEYKPNSDTQGKMLGNLDKPYRSTSPLVYSDCVMYIV